MCESGPPTEVVNAHGPLRGVVHDGNSRLNREAGPTFAQIHVPTLLMVGRHDTMSVDDIQKMGRAIPHSRVAVCENGSHLGMWDDQQAYFRHLIGFLKDVERGGMKKA